MSRFKSKAKVIRNTCERQLKGIDFIGGTFVEYEKGTDKELWRGTITKFKCLENAFSIQTKESEECTNFLKLGSPHLSSMSSSITKVINNIWYIDTGVWLGWMCAIAPKGVEIK